MQNNQYAFIVHRASSGMISDIVSNPLYDDYDKSNDKIGACIYLKGPRMSDVGLSLSVYEDRKVVTPPRAPRASRAAVSPVDAYRRRYWSKMSETAAWDVSVANTYMRARGATALLNAVSLFGDLTVSESNSTIRYIASRITEEQARRHMRAIRNGGGRTTCINDVYISCRPPHAAIHVAAMGRWFSGMDKESKWSAVHDFARSLNNTIESFDKAVGRVVAQSSSSPGKFWLKYVTRPLKGVGAAIKRFAQFGVAGRIIIYAAIALILGKMICRLPWWSIVLILTCSELGWIREYSQDVADILPRDDEEEFEFDHGVARRAADWYPDIFNRPEWFDSDTSDEGDDVVAQSGLGVTVIATGITAIIARRVPLYTKIVNGPKFKAGIEDILHGVEGAFESVTNLVLKAFGSKRIVRLRRQQAGISSLCDGADALDVEVRAKGCEIDDTMFQRFARLIAQGEESLTQWPRDSDEWRRIKKAMSVLVKLSCDYPAHFNSAKARIEPIGLMLAGSPGLGKTTLLKSITRIVARYEFPDEPYDMSRHMFQKPVGPYYEGYKGQTVFCVDDIFTKKPVAGEVDGDAETVVKLVNQWPLALNMANCALKGRFYMTSPYVIATTNLTTMADLGKAVTDVKAITRRFPLWFNVHLRDGAVITPGCNPDEVWYFTKANFTDSGNTEPPLTFTDVMLLLFEERRRRIRFASSEVIGDEYLDRLFEDIDSCRAVADLRAGVVAQSGVGSFVKRVVTRAVVGVAGACVAMKAVTAGARCLTQRAVRVVRRQAPIVLSKLVAITPVMAARATLFATLLVVAFRGLSAMITSAFGLFRWGGKEPRCVTAQSSVRDEVAELVQRNMFTVHCQGVRLGYALGLDDMTLTLPAHFLEDAEKRRGPLVAIGRRGNSIALPGPERVDVARDLAYFRVKTMCKDITKCHIASSPKEKELYLVRPNSIVPCATTLQPRNVRYSGSCNRHPVERTMHVHTARTNYGDCGAIIMAQTGKGGRRIYGMHTAADLGASTYAGCYTAFGTSVVAQSGSEFCGHKLVGKLIKPIHNGGDTRLEPTPYAGCNGEVKTLPSAKRPINGVDPMLKAISGYKREWGPVPDEMGACVKAVVAEIFEAIKDYDLSPVSMWEAAAGIAGEPYCKGLARGKSPGYPFIEKYHDKKQMLGVDGPYVKGPAYGELEAAVNELAAKYKNGERGAVYRDSLKDEPRKKSKVEACQTRMISGCPVELAVLGRMQTLRFTSALMMTRHEHGIMPGFNPYGMEANQLYHRLAFVNSKCNATAGDYKEFDKTQHPTTMGMIWSDVSARLVARGCDPEILAGLGRDTFNAIHLGGNSYTSDTLYEVDGTLPSGHWMTSFLNSIYNAVVLRYCWVRYKGSVASVYDFARHVAAVYYGDDFVFAADDDNQGFGLDVLQRHVAELGMMMTDEDGNAGGAPNKDLFDVSFLCRRFRVDSDGVVWMPLDCDSIDDMYNWKKKSTPIQQHTEAIIRASLMEAAAHDIECFTRYYRLAQEIGHRYVCRFPEISLDLASAYDHWRQVHKGHVPVWSDEEE